MFVISEISKQIYVQTFWNSMALWVQSQRDGQTYFRV